MFSYVQNINSIEYERTFPAIALFLLNLTGPILITILFYISKLIKRIKLCFSMSEKSVQCPYCQSMFSNNEDLSKHIDRIHLGSGLLEGDTRKF
jgi:uncharacterized C2H2 Zn-finger protein